MIWCEHFVCCTCVVLGILVEPSVCFILCLFCASLPWTGCCGHLGRLAHWSHTEDEFDEESVRWVFAWEKHSICWFILWWHGLTGWPRGTHTHLWTLSPGFESLPSYKLSSRCFISKVIHQYVCCPSDRCWTGVPSASIPWWTLKIPSCSVWRVCELSPAPWTNCKFLP